MGVKVLVTGHAGTRGRLERTSIRRARLSELTRSGVLNASLRPRASAPAAVSA
jgi:hypothetical protein